MRIWPAIPTEALDSALQFPLIFQMPDSICGQLNTSLPGRGSLPGQQQHGCTLQSVRFGMYCPSSHACACNSMLTMACSECRFGKARIFVDGVELLVRRYSFLQQVHLPSRSVRWCYDLSMSSICACDSTGLCMPSIPEVLPWMCERL